MPDLYDNSNIIDKGFETFCKVQRQTGAPPPDEVSFVGGFLTCFGIITGRVDIGLDLNAPLTKILENIHKDISAVGMRVSAAQARQECFDQMLTNAVNSMKNGNG